MKRESFAKTAQLTSLLLGWLLLGGLQPAFAFNSGSTGANGPFPPVAYPAGTTTATLDLRDGIVTFMPDGTTALLPSVSAGGFADGVVHFTTVDLPVDVTLTVLANAGHTPVAFLAQGNVNLAGKINFSGEPGGGALVSARGGMGGPGGFKGGNGQVLTGSPEAGQGLGPGGGKGGAFGADIDGGGGGGGFGTAGSSGTGASLVVNGGVSMARRGFCFHWSVVRVEGADRLIAEDWGPVRVEGEGVALC
jgi:hypothetical protein